MTSIGQRFNILKTNFESGKTLSDLWRRDQLEKLLKLFQDNKTQILQAIKEDTGKPEVEVYLTELGVIDQQISYMLKYLHSLLTPKTVRTPMMQRPSAAYQIYQPKGVIFLASPIDYPLNYLFVAVAGAIAAGNCVMVFPYGFEVMPSLSSLIMSLMSRYLDTQCIMCIKQETSVLNFGTNFDFKWDHMMFIGNSILAHQVMEVAKRHTIRLSLLIDTKCPAIVDESCDLQVSVKRLLWGKFLGAGQTIMSPAYVLVHKSIEMDFLLECQRVLTEFFGSNPLSSQSYARITSKQRYDKLVELLKSGGHIYYGGVNCDSERYISPTILDNVGLNSPIMQENFLGPILPVLNYDTIDQAIHFVNERPKASALYLFSNSKDVQDKVLLNTISGSCVINDVLIQMSIEELPYSGVGESGVGLFNGRETFKTFSYSKSVLHKATWMDPSMRYPPYQQDATVQMGQLLL